MIVSVLQSLEAAVILSKSPFSIIAYSVTDIFAVNSTVDETAGEYKTDMGLPAGS
jgi:hypothetical protein